MSDSVYDLIVRGVAAARSAGPQSKEEARYYLEKALRRDDAEPDQSHDDLLVPASPLVPGDFPGSLLAFDTEGLVPFSADLLAGYAAGIHQVTLDEASLLARQRALEEGRRHEQKTSLAGERYRDFVMNSSGLVVVSYKLVLLPFWIGGYRYRGVTYSAIVNGQSGSVAGRVPRNSLQRILARLWGG